MTPDIAWTLGTFSAIFFVVDPIAVVPIFLAIPRTTGRPSARSMALRASAIAMAVLIGFLFGGQALFQVFGVTLPAFKVAGGILLLLTALDQLRSKKPETRTTGGDRRGPPEGRRGDRAARAAAAGRAGVDRHRDRARGRGRSPVAARGDRARDRPDLRRRVGVAADREPREPGARRHRAGGAAAGQRPAARGGGRPVRHRPGSGRRFRS